MGKLLQIALFFFFAKQAPVVADEAAQSMHEVLQIARAISVVQPNLKDGKYIEYALGIYRASKRYEVEPAVLIAITQQESGFRERLPEGPAGEIGMCQILKNWLQNEKFKDEFGTVTIEDMKRPAKSFLFQAWILRDLKDKIAPGTLPYWSFYNSRKFENRFKYFLRVNRNIAALRRYAPAVYEAELVTRRAALIDPPVNSTRTAVRAPASEPVALAGLAKLPPVTLRRPKVFTPLLPRELPNATRRRQAMRSAALSAPKASTMVD